MLDIEIALVKAFGWSLKDIDETDVESLIPFVLRFSQEGGPAETKTVYCDEAGWL